MLRSDEVLIIVIFYQESFLFLQGSSERIHPAYVETFDELISRCHKNSLSKSLLYLQKALMSGNSGQATKQQKKLLEVCTMHEHPCFNFDFGTYTYTYLLIFSIQDALDFIKKAEGEEKRLYTDNILISPDSSQIIKVSKVPPAPILLSRTDTSMVFKPDCFKPSSGEKV